MKRCYFKKRKKRTGKKLLLVLAALAMGRAVCRALLLFGLGKVPAPFAGAVAGPFAVCNGRTLPAPLPPFAGASAALAGSAATSSTVGASTTLSPTSLGAATILPLTLISLTFRLREFWQAVTKVPEEYGEHDVREHCETTQTRPASLGRPRCLR